LSSTFRSLILGYCEREQAHDEHKKAERDQAQEHALFDTALASRNIPLVKLDGSNGGTELRATARMCSDGVGAMCDIVFRSASAETSSSDFFASINVQSDQRGQ
jgi:hypothetical protein